MGYLVLFLLLCLTFLGISIYNSRGLPKLTEVPELAIGIVLGGSVSMFIILGIVDVLSAMFGA